MYSNVLLITTQIMIELLNWRRMIAIVVILAVLMVIIIIWEDLMADNVHTSPYHPLIHTTDDIINKSIETSVDLNSSHLIAIKRENTNTESKCWQYQQFQSITDCLPCDKTDTSSKLLTACKKTGYKQRIKCQTIGLVYRWCNTNEANFWTFEFMMIFVAIFSGFYVKRRQRYIYHKTIERIERQIAS
ncbi:protein JTB-like [Oppia nitens]|uniref:protein JTB-like n=1 Tax=Oppia nitens TaxID=1686743 RepID=UPI0023DB0EE6|nr:protein JTB-like [Oppia nitens]